VEGTAGVLPGGLVPRRLAVHASPAAYDALDVLGGAGATDRQQALLGFRRGDTRESTDLGVCEFTTGKSVG
jgi:hypothetical protein